MQGVMVYIENDMWRFVNVLSDFEIQFIYTYNLVYGMLRLLSILLKWYYVSENSTCYVILRSYNVYSPIMMYVMIYIPLCISLISFL